MKKILIIIVLFLIISCTQKTKTDKETENQQFHNNQKQVIYYDKEDDIHFITLLYPNHSYTNKENQDGWHIYSKSKTNFQYHKDDYEIITYNEINNPNSLTQMDHYNHGGIIIIKKEKIICLKTNGIQTIEKIIESNNDIYILFKEVIANRGYEKSYLNIAKFSDDHLNFVRKIQITDSDLYASGTFHKEATITYTNIDSDNILDIKLDYFDYKIVDFELSKEKTLYKTKKYILK